MTHPLHHLDALQSAMAAAGSMMTTRFECATCRTPYMVLALDAEAEGRALADWTCPECSPLSPPSAFPPDPIPKAAIWLALCCALVIVGIPVAVVAGWVR